MPQGERTAIAFLLRSNAHAMVVGQGGNSVRRRVKIASLLHDEVFLEGGAWHANAGDRGSFAFRMPVSDIDRRWQSSKERGYATGRPFFVNIRPDDAPSDAPFHTMIYSDATLSWRASFQPIIDELPKAYRWIDSDRIADPPEVKALADSWIRVDERDEALKATIPVQFVRELVLEGANYDLALAAFVGSAVSMDAYHARLIGSRVQRRVALPVFGHHGMRILVPDIDQLGWDEIDGLRRHRGWRSYRSAIRDIEIDAWNTMLHSGGLERHVRDAYDERLRAANERLRGSFHGRFVAAVLAATVGLAGVVPGLASSIALNEIMAKRSQSRWVMFDVELRRRIRSADKASRTTA